MTYPSRPPAPGRYHLGPLQGEPGAGYDRPGDLPDPATSGFLGEPEQPRPGVVPPAQPGQLFRSDQPAQPGPPGQAQMHQNQDALPAWPDAQPPWPDAQQARPDVQPARPEAQLAWPDGQQVRPEAQQAWPEAQQAWPDAQRARPGARQARPEAQQAWPEAQQAWPDARPGRPDSGPGWQGQTAGAGWQDPDPGWRAPRSGRPGPGAWTETAPGWQPPYPGAAEFQQEHVAAPAWVPEQPQSPQRPGSEPISSTVRGQIVERMIRINTSHALQAADRVGTKLAVGPHCLALFSVDNVPGRYQRLSTATRLILDGEDAESLPDLLRDLTARAQEMIAEARGQGRRWEPRTPLTGLVLRSEEFSEETAYVGLGVSTLDTPDVPWRLAKQRVTGADGLHLRGQGMIYLRDGTAMHVVRRAQMASGQHEITASRRVDSQYPSRRDEQLIERAVQQGEESWELMRHLHEVLLTA